MPLAYHADAEQKYTQQVENARTYIVPFIDAVIPVEGKRVLEIGCGEAGILRAFLERGCTCTGVDLASNKIAHAREALAEPIAEGRLTLIDGDIYNADVSARLEEGFDIVLMKDTIEHIYGHYEIMAKIRDFLVPGGILFVGFPPWRMPFGGHQQMADSRVGKLPYYHLLPRPAYRRLLRLFGESEERIEVLMEIVDTRLSIHDFEDLVRRAGYRVIQRQLYLINPIYRYKFGLTPRKQLPGLRSLPWVRDFVTTTCYYLVQPI